MATSPSSLTSAEGTSPTPRSSVGDSGIQSPTQVLEQLHHLKQEKARLQDENARLQRRCLQAEEEAKRYDVLCRCFTASTRNFRAVLEQLEDQRNDKIRSWMEATGEK